MDKKSHLKELQPQATKLLWILETNPIHLYFILMLPLSQTTPTKSLPQLSQGTLLSQPQLNLNSTQKLGVT